MSNVSGRPFSMVMRANSLMEVFIFDGGCLGRVTGPRKEVLVVVEMVVGMVGTEVLTNLGALMEVVILVLLMVGREGGHIVSKCKKDEFEGVGITNFGFIEEIPDVPWP